MERRTFAIVSILCLLAAGVGWAQEIGRNFRAGIITGGGNAQSATFIVAFEERLRELGWVVGKTPVHRLRSRRKPRAAIRHRYTHGPATHGRDLVGGTRAGVEGG